MARRHAIDVFDPDLIRKQTQTEVRAKMAASGQVKVTMSADSPFMKKLYEVAARQEARDRAREDERRRRDQQLHHRYFGERIALAPANC